MNTKKTKMDGIQPHLESVTAQQPCPDPLPSWLLEDEQEFQARHNRRLVKRLRSEQRQEFGTRLFVTAFLLVGIAMVFLIFWILATNRTPC